MALDGFDKLMSLTDSRYRLALITARRASQLQGGLPTTLPDDELPDTNNPVSLAMRELELEQDIIWGEDLPSEEELRRLSQKIKRAKAAFGNPEGN